MKNAVLLLAAIVALSSCSRLKKLSSDQEKYSKQVTTTDTSETITTSERIDTTITLRPIEYNVTNHLLYLVDSSVLILDTPELAIEAKFDTLTKTIRTKAKVKERKVELVKHKTTEIKRSGQSKFKSIQYEDNEVKTKEKTTFNWWWIVILLSIVGAYLFFRNALPFKIIRK